MSKLQILLYTCNKRIQIESPFSLLILLSEVCNFLPQLFKSTIQLISVIIFVFPLFHVCIFFSFLLSILIFSTAVYTTIRRIKIFQVICLCFVYFVFCVVCGWFFICNCSRSFKFSHMPPNPENSNQVACPSASFLRTPCELICCKVIFLLSIVDDRRPCSLPGDCECIRKYGETDRPTSTATSLVSYTSLVISLHCICRLSPITNRHLCRKLRIYYNSGQKMFISS